MNVLLFYDFATFQNFSQCTSSSFCGPVHTRFYTPYTLTIWFHGSLQWPGHSFTGNQKQQLDPKQLMSWSCSSGSIEAPELAKSWCGSQCQEMDKYL